MKQRNRAQGWKYAKISGHKNENLIENLLLNNKQYVNFFLKKIFPNKTNYYIKNVDSNGINESNVESILGGTTKSKTDLRLLMNDNLNLNISIKKSNSGQVYLITKENFISGFESLFYDIPEKIKVAIFLFWSGRKDKDLSSIINTYGVNKDYEKRKNRLVADTLKNYKPELYNDLITWFKKNIYEITIFCFSSGLVKNKSNYADFVWYKNLVDIELQDMDYIFNIKTLAEKAKKNTHLINYGNRGGGTTINLPFGFVQWHQNSLQFHHKLNFIIDLFN